MNTQATFEYPAVDTVLNALMVGGLACTGALALVVCGVVALMA